MDSLMSVEDLCVQFNMRRVRVMAVNGVTFGLTQGEILGLVGETGSGKSVTALSILQLVPAPGRIVRGRIVFRGEDLLTKTEKEMRDQVRGRQISMIFQDPKEALNPVFRVRRQLTEVYRTHTNASKGEAYREALNMMRAVGIPDAEARMDAYPYELSGGMCQRVMIGMSLLCKPRLLIADEPTTGLDVTVQADVLELVTELVRSAGTSCLYITHNMGVVAQVCDRLAVMYAGRICETGTVEAVFNEALHPYTQGLIAATLRPDRKARIRVVPGEVPDGARLPPGCAFWPRCEHAMRVCRERYPERAELGVGRSVSCHRVKEGY